MVNKHSEFLQSPDWAKFQESLGHEVFQLGDYFVFKKRLRFGFTQIYAPRLPTDNDLLAQIEGLAKNEGVSFLRLEPALNELTPTGYHKVGDHNPSRTLIIDLTKEIEVLESELHPKTKYNIGLAKKKGMTVRKSGIEDYELFWKLIAGTYSRKGIVSHLYDYYKKILEANKGAYLAFAEFDGKVIVANLLIAFGDTVTYLHGGSDNEYRAMMGPQFLQWESILEAKGKGFKYYDFWGIAPNEDPKHPWAGITRFKKGFGGLEVQYPGTFEKEVGWKYKLYRVLARLR